MSRKTSDGSISMISTAIEESEATETDLSQEEALRDEIRSILIDLSNLEAFTEEYVQIRERLEMIEGSLHSLIASTPSKSKPKTLNTRYSDGVISKPLIDSSRRPSSSTNSSSWKDDSFPMRGSSNKFAAETETSSTPRQRSKSKGAVLSGGISFLREKAKQATDSFRRPLPARPKVKSNRRTFINSMVPPPPEDLIASVENMELDTDDLTFINNYAKASNVTISMSEKVSIVNALNDTQRKIRLLLITKHRIICIRKGALKGLVVRHNYPIISLKSFSVTGTEHASFRNVYLEFNAFQKDEPESLIVYCRAGQAKRIFLNIIGVNKISTYLYPISEQAVFTVEKEWMEEFKPEDPGEHSMKAITACFNAMCDFFNTTPRQDVLLVLEDLLESRSHIFDLRIFFEDMKSVNSDELYALCWTLRHQHLWDSIESNNLSLGAEGANSVGLLLTAGATFKSISLTNAKIDSRGIFALSKHLDHWITASVTENCPILLKNLNLSDNKIGDDGIKYLQAALSKGVIPFERVILKNCGLGHQGAFYLEQLLYKFWLSSLTLLNLSGNKLGKKGSSALATFLESCTVLEQLHVAYCDLHMKTIFQSLSKNTYISQDVLKVLNIAGNKIANTSSSLLSVFLTMTNSLQTVNISNTKLNDSSLLNILEGIASNTSNKAIACNFSQNDFDKGFGNALPLALQNVRQEAFQTMLVLNLSKCKMKEDALIDTCKALLLIPSLQMLIMDKTAPVLQKGVEDIGVALTGLIDNLPNLLVLSIRGNQFSNYGDALIPLLDALGRNKSLLSIDLSGNQLSTRCYQRLKRSLASNQTLRCLHIDKNYAKLSNLLRFTEAVLGSKSLCGNVPTEDFLNQRTFNRNIAETNQMVNRLQKHFSHNAEANPAKNDDPVLSLLQLYVDESENSVARAQILTSSLFTSEDEKSVGTGDSSRKTKFGVSIETLESRLVPGYASGIPAILCEMKEFLLANGALTQVGVFRLAPNQSEVSVVREQLESGSFEFCEDINVIAALVKNWFRECPDKILKNIPTDLLYGASTSEEKCQKCVNTLEDPFKSIFLWLVDLCVAISSFQNVNKMNAKNLSIVFAPNMYPFENLDPVKALRTSEELTSFMTAMIDLRSKSHPFDPTYATPITTMQDSISMQEDEPSESLDEV